VDGVRLWAWYVPPIDGKVVVLRHGAGSTAADVRFQASVLVDNGYGVLITDARGHGHSDGAAMDFGWHGNEDIAAAVTFLSRQPEVDAGRIGVVGMSMGGEEAIGAIGFDDRIRAVVAEGATARTDADKAWLEDEYGWRGWIQLRLEWLQYTVADLLTEAEKPESLASSARRASPRPILMITAGLAPDEQHAARFVAAGNENVKIWTVPDAGHIQGITTAAEDWERVVVEFLDEALEAPPNPAG
jgi:pimeloyl-ACP methyl ester carboxylesterase